MSLLELSSKLGKKKRKRVGRGNGSGHGTFCGRGVKGQKARSGGTIPPGFEGGQTPLSRKMPKLRGFKNPNHKIYHIINVGQLNVFENNEKVDAKALLNKKIIANLKYPVKLLGDGELEKTIEITVDKASKSAVKKVESKKGKVNLLKAEKEKEKSK